MEESKKQLFIAAIIVIIGGNASGVISAVNPSSRTNTFTSLDAAILEARMIERYRKDVDVYREKIGVLGFKVDECMKRVQRGK